MLATYSSARSPVWDRATRAVGFGPFGFEKLRDPFPFKITSRPSARAFAAVGYHPVGTNPSTRLRASVTSTTPAALASEHTTKSRLWSRLSASALGVIPKG